MRVSVTTFDQLTVWVEHPGGPSGREQPWAAGPLRETHGAGRPADIGGSKPRLLLAVLVVRANRLLRVEELTEALWAGRPPLSARKNLQVYVSRLRRVLGPRLAHAHGGYVLRLGAHECDLLRFEEQVRAGRERVREGDPAAAIGLLDAAVGLWRGTPLSEFDDVPCVTEAVDRLHELFLWALEEWAELECERGGHRRVLDRLLDHIGRHPLRERLAAMWIRALADSGRESEALMHYETVRQALARELGTMPGPALTVLQRRLLRSADPPRPAGPGGPGRPVHPGRPELSVLRQHGLGNQLPRDLPDFVGRALLTRRALARFGVTPGAPARPDRGSGAVVVLSGPVGSGKTALAVHVAHLLAATGGWPDGSVMAHVGREPLGAVLRSLLDTVGLPHKGSVVQALARWRTWVAARRLVVVLDGAVSGRVVRELLPGSGASATLVTSRYRLSGLEANRLSLPALDERDGCELLGRIIGPARVAAERTAAGRIVATCEGLPLAVRIAGARLALLRHIALAEYAARLDGAVSLLDEMAVGELVLRARYESLWRDLPERPRAALLMMAADVPPYDLDPSALAVEDLMEHHLVTPVAGADGLPRVPYRLSAFVREFVGGVLTEEGADAGSGRAATGSAAPAT